MMVVTNPTIEKAKAQVDGINRAFGKMIRDYRIKNSLSVNEVSRKAGLSWRTWRAIEQGDSRTLLQIVKAARAVGLYVYLEVEEE